MNVLGFRLPQYHSPTLLLSLGLSLRVLWHLVTKRPDVIHVSTPGVMAFAAILYAKMLSVPLVMSYHTHVPEYIPRYTWSGLVAPMWAIIRFYTRMADLTLVTSKAMKVRCHDVTRCRGAFLADGALLFNSLVCKRSDAPVPHALALSPYPRFCFALVAVAWCWHPTSNSSPLPP